MKIQDKDLETSKFAGINRVKHKADVFLRKVVVGFEHKKMDRLTAGLREKGRAVLFDPCSLEVFKNGGAERLKALINLLRQKGFEVNIDVRFSNNVIRRGANYTITLKKRTDQSEA